MRISCKINVIALYYLISLIQRSPIGESRAVFVVNDFQALALDKVILQGVSTGQTDFDLKVQPATCIEGCILKLTFSNVL